MRLHPFVGFLRTVLTLVEQTLQLTDYQIRLWPSAEPIPEQLLKGKPGWADATQLLLAAPAVADSVARAGFYMLVVGSSARGREVVASSYLLRRVSSSPTSAESLHTMDEPIDYTDGNGKHVQLPLTQRDILVTEGEHARCFLDAQGRPMYVVVMKRFVAAMSELADDELRDLWLVAMQAVSEGEATGLIDIRINCGNFMNVSHLHLKVQIEPEVFKARWKGHTTYEVLTQRLKKEAVI